MLPDAEFNPSDACLSCGDRLVLDTDGVTEAFNGADEEYGEEQTAYPKPTVEELMAAATVAPNDDMHWDEWNKHGMAIFSAFPNADGLAAFDLLSSKSSKYDVIIDGKTGKQRTAAKWKAYFNNPPRSADDGGVTIGTFFALANEADPGWRARLRGQQTAATMPETVVK